MRPPLLEFLNLQGGTAALRWLPWARNKAQQLYDLGLASKCVVLGDSTAISIRLEENLAHIRIVAGVEGGYQFIGSAQWLYKTYRDPAFPTGYDRMLPLGYATLVESKGGFVKAAPLFSSIEDASGAWPFDADPRTTDTHLRLRPAHQWDGMGVQQWYAPTGDDKKRDLPNLITSWQQAHPCEGLGWYGSGSAARFVTLDMSFDYGPLLFTTDNPLIGANKTPDSDWYGQACWRTVDSAFGPRTFIIMVDVNSVFYCYPTEGYGDTILFGTYTGQKGNVPASLTQSQACPWPSWVTHEDLGMVAVLASVPTATHKARLRPMWTFNHAGTRAACITAERTANWVDAYFNSEFYDDTGTLQTTYQEDYPGLVEVEFSISITGPALADFTFTTTLRQSLYSGTDHRCPVAVGYAVRDMGGIALDTLLLLEYQHYVDNPALTQGPTNTHGSVETYTLRRPNKASVAVVSAQTNAGWIEARRWLAYYACYPPLGDNRLFHPQIQEFQAFAGQTGYANHFRYIANLVALDMDSLSFCIGATVRTIGDIQTGTSTWQTNGAEAATVLTIAFNTERDRQSVGHAELKSVVSAMLDLTADYPDLGSMTEFDLSASLDYAHYDASAWESDAHVLATKYATLTVRDGFGSSWATLVEGASENLMLYSNILAVPAFATASHIYGPQVYTYWDGLPNVRPGIRWAVGGTLQAGTLSFSNYPYGAIHHNSVLFLTTTALNNVGARFSTHRNGSWALFAGPFAARTDLSPWWENGVALTAPALAYEQTLVDAVVFASDRGATSKEVVTTHLALFNQAFKKTLEPEDFYFTMAYDSSVGATIQPAATNPSAPSQYQVTVLAPLGIIWSHQSFQLNRWYDEWCFNSSFVLQKLHTTDNSFTCFPTPRQEGVFLPP